MIVFGGCTTFAARPLVVDDVTKDADQREERIVGAAGLGGRRRLSIDTRARRIDRGDSGYRSTIEKRDSSSSVVELGTVASSVSASAFFHG